MNIKNSNKIQIEELIPEFITDKKMRKSAMDFTAWLRSNKMTLGKYGINRWKASNKGTGICFIVLGSNVWKQHDFWVIRLDLTHIKEYETEMMNEGLQEFVWSNIHHCWQCARCAPGVDMTIFGKEYQGLCKTMILYSGDPNEEELNAIKKLLEFEKKARSRK